MDFEVDGRKAYAYTAAHALDAGKPTIVFVHGAGLDHSWWGLQSRYFGYHGWNVLACDLPGHGRSEGPPVDSIVGAADWVMRLLDTAGVAKASVVGHSLGSLVALECAARNPERVERIALVGTAFPMNVSDAFLEAARDNDQSAYDMETIWGTPRRCRSAETRIRACGCMATPWRGSPAWRLGSSTSISRRARTMRPG